MKNITRYFLLLFLLCVVNSFSQNENNKEHYTYKKGDINGIGKWYMGREIAFVMGYQGINWLERPERDLEENTTKLIQNLNIKATDIVADIGAGSGYHVFKIAPLLTQGTVYAVDIQEEMLFEIAVKAERQKVNNVEIVKGDLTTTNLPKNTIDKVLMVDVYHEFSFPREMLLSIKEALKPNGKIYLLEYRKEDPSVPIKEIHKMTVKQAVKEFEALGFKLVENKQTLPLQHCMIFEKTNL